MLTFSISGEKSVPESGGWTTKEAERPPHSHRRDHDCGAAAPPGDQRRQRLVHPGGHRLRQPHTGCILQLNTSRMMVQTQHIYVSTTHPPAHPFLNVGRVKGVSWLIQNFTYFYKSKTASHKCRVVKYVLTRSSEFQQNRKETQLRGTEIPRKKNKKKKFNSTENPIKQTSAKTTFYKQKMSSHAHKLRQHKNFKIQLRN